MSQDAVQPRRGAPWVLLGLALATTGCWVWLLTAGLRGADATGGWGPGVALGASGSTLVLAAWLPVVAVRRWLPPPWRAVTAAVGSALLVGAGLWLAVAVFASA